MRYHFGKTVFILVASALICTLLPAKAMAQSQIELLGNGVVIASGDTTPSVVDGTDFGLVNSGPGSVKRTIFTVSNPGDINLILTTNPRVIRTSGSARFTVTQQPSGTVLAGGTRNFEVTFDPLTFQNGILQTAVFSITNDNTNGDASPYTFTVSGTGQTIPDIVILGSGNRILDGDTTPRTADGTDFGSIDTATGAGNSSFFVANDNPSNALALTGMPIVTISGANAADFTVTAQPPTNTITNNVAQFDVQFNPSADGLRTATISIASDDPDENPYTYTIQGTGTSLPLPEINVTGLGVSIVSGDTTPQVADNTDFGNVAAVGAQVSHTFTIENTGLGLLTLGANAVTKSGANQAEFVITTQPASTVAPGGTTTFDVQFDPFNISVHSVTLSINNDDPDENPYSFTLQGTGTGAAFAPEIKVEGAGSLEVIDGDTTPLLADGTDFGPQVLASTSAASSFFISNTFGTATLTLGTVTLTGANAGDFAISEIPAGNVAQGGASTILGITFTPSAVGLRTATVTIPNNDPDENPYTFAVQGTGIGLAPEIKVVGLASLDIPDGDITPNLADGTDFGTGNVGSLVSTSNFFISNAPGTTILNIGPVTITGANAGDFIIATPLPASSLAINGVTTLQIRFNPGAAGLRTATVTIPNNDADENPYTFNIQGTGTGAADVTAPRVASITRQNPTTQNTSADTLTWRVTFDEPVQNVHVGTGGNFFVSAPAGSGLGPITFAVTTVSTSIYDVTISGGGLPGLNATVTFGINNGALIDITDLAGNVFTNTTPIGANDNDFIVSNGAAAAPEINVTGLGVSIVDGDTTPMLADDTDFGDVLAVGAQVTHTFTIENTGTSVLTLGANAVTKSGANQAEFVITTQPASTVAPGGTTTFDVRFDPFNVSVHSVTLSINNDDADENPYTFALQGTGTAGPEIDITGLGQNILSGDTTPSVADNTDFGSHNVAGGQQASSFTVFNNGAGTGLLLFSPFEPRVVLSGAHAGDFTVTDSLVNGIGVGTFDTFSIVFNPTDLGLRTATVSISNNDADENPFTFSIQGTGVDTIAPRVASIDTLFVGPQTDSDEIIWRIIFDETVLNLTLDDFAISGTTAVLSVRGGPIDNPGIGTLIDIRALGGDLADLNGTIVLSFTPGHDIIDAVGNAFTNPVPLGLDDRSVQIINLDPDIRISSTPGGGVEIVNGDITPSAADNTDFGSSAVGAAPVPVNFGIANTVNFSTLVLPNGNVTFSGPAAADFSLPASNSERTLLGLSSTGVVVEFSPSTVGLRSATISIASNDPDENPFTFAVQGTGTSTPPEMAVLGNNNAIVNGDTSPIVADGTDFGSLDTVTGSGTSSFIIANDNVANPLLLTGNPIVTISGTHAADFAVTAQPATTTIAGNTVQFDIRFDPSATGIRTATVSITSNDADDNPYTFALQGTGTAAAVPEIRVEGSGRFEIVDGDTTPNTSDGTAFGSVAVGQSPNASFFIINTGTADLTLGAVTITGSGDFSVIGAPSSPITSLNPNFTVLQITYAPSSAGVANATVSIPNNDSDENPYTFAITGTGVAPEIDVSGNGTSIVSGDLVANTSDGTDFGSGSVGSNVLSTNFTISNQGNLALTIGTVTITGADAGDFSITTIPASNVNPGANTILQITFNPSAIGVRGALVTIPNNDADESVYSFGIRGIGTGMAEMNVIGNAVTIADGDTTPEAVDHTNFGSTDITAGTINRTFTVQNIGTDVLTLGANAASLSGANAGDYSVTTQPATSVAPGDFTSVVVRFDPAALGSRTAVLTIVNDDVDESPYNFAISGTGTGAPEINVTGNAIIIVDGDTTPDTADDTDFGFIGVNMGTVVNTFTIENNGTDVLTLGANAATLGGTDAADFMVVVQPATTIAPGGTSTVGVRFDPSTSAVRNATLSIANDDSDEAPFDFAISGTGSLAPTVLLSGVPAQSNAAFTVTITFSEDVTGFTLGEITVGNGAASNLAGSGTVYTALITPNNQGQVTINVAGGVAQSVAASLNNIAAAQAVSNFDNVEPGVVISGVPANTNAAFTATFTFSEDVSGFVLADITVGNGVASGFVTTNARVYTAAITPTADGNVSIDVAAGVAQDGVANPNTAAAQAVSAFDATAPSVVISGVPASTSAAFTATFTFSETVTGLILGDITVGNGAASNFAGSGTTYTATITPDGNGDITIDVAAGAAQDDATNDNTAAAQVLVGFDGTAPSVVISGAPAITNAAFTATFTFSEDVSGFVLANITVGNGVASSFVATSASVYTATITPAADGNVSIDVAAGMAQDGVANPNTAAVQIISVFDGTPPNVVISGVPATSNAAFTATFTFSEDVSGFVLADITVGNGVASGFATISASIYTAIISPNADGNVSINVAAGVAQDAHTNPNTVAVQAVSSFDSTPPSVVISGAPVTVNTAFTATFTFSEIITGFAISDISVSNATTSNFAGSGTTYTTLITPTNGGNLTIDVAAGVAQDGAMNTNIAAVQAVSNFDNVVPTVSVSGLPANTNTAFTATFTFSESVTGFVQNDITLSNGAASNFAGSGTTYTALLTPDGNGDLVVSLAAHIAADAAGNGNTAMAAATVAVDIRAPRIASITRLAPTTLLTADDNLTWQVTFDEDVQNVDVSDFTVTGTTATISLSAGSARIYDVTIAGGDLAELNATVTLAISAQNNITDQIGNAMVELVPSGQNDNIFNVQNDVVAPTVTVSGVPEAIAGPFTITFTFSEPVIGFVIGDILVTNGSVSNFTSPSKSALAKDGGNTIFQAATVFSALITPNAEGALTITLNVGAYSDVAGNANTAVSVVSTVVDTTSPTVVLSGVPESVRGPFGLTISFNEDVSGFELIDIGLVNARGSNFTAVNARVYTALISPIAQGDVTMSVAAGVAIDAAGNANRAAAPVSVEYIDESFVRNRTLRVINNFLVKRADQISLNDPDLSHRLTQIGTRGNLTGNAVRRNTQLAFNGTVSGDDAKLYRIIGADAASRVQAWTEASLSVVKNENATNNLTLLYAGLDYRLNEDMLVGVMGQYDRASEDNLSQNYDISGSGWMVGPYIVTRLSGTLIFDGRASWGQSSNDVSPFNTYTDTFKTSRWLLKGQLTGDYKINDWRINPNLAVIYFADKQKTYTDSLGINIPGQTVNLGRVTFGPRFSKSFEQSETLTLVPSFAFKGIWDFEKSDIVNLDTGLANGAGALRLRTEAGLAANTAKGTRLSVKGFYDGVGVSDFEAYGIKFGLNFPIQ